MHHPHGLSWTATWNPTYISLTKSLINYPWTNSALALLGCSLNHPSTLLTQELCTSSFLCLEHSSPTQLLHFFQVSPSQWSHSQMALFKIAPPIHFYTSYPPYLLNFTYLYIYYLLAYLFIVYFPPPKDVISIFHRFFTLIYLFFKIFVGV